MANQEFDPFRAWQDLVQKWEIEINEWSGKMTESDQFSAMMGQATKMNLVAQKAWAITERLDRIEDNIERMRLAMEQSGKPQARPEPSRTRKAPKKPE